MERLIKGHVTKNAKVIEESGIYLKSYKTYVIRIRDSRMVITGLYSSTTRRHISWFLKDKLSKFTFQDVRKADLLGYAIDVNTGEPLELTEEEVVFINRQRRSYYGY